MSLILVQAFRKRLKAKLFEQFTTTKPHGLALACLSRARLLMRIMDGCGGEPNHGGGTIFSFVLPLAGQQQMSEQQSS